MPDGHSEVEPPLPIPNRIVKRLSADDSAGPGVKVGHCQATSNGAPYPLKVRGFLLYMHCTRIKLIASVKHPPYYYPYV